MSVRHSVRNKQVGFQYMNSYEIWYLKIFPICVEISQFSMKSNNNNRYIILKTDVHLWQYLAELFLEWILLQM